MFSIDKDKEKKWNGARWNINEDVVSFRRFQIEKVTELINTIYDSGEISEDHNWGIFIMLPNKPSVNECELRLKSDLLNSRK